LYENDGENNKFSGNRGELINFAEIKGEYAICIIGLGWMDAPEPLYITHISVSLCIGLLW